MAPSGDQHTQSHFALMDKVYRRQRHFYDFTRRYYLFGRDRLIRKLTIRPGERVIEIGCGTARNLIRIARRFPGAELYGIDASSEMLVSAKAAIARHRLGSRIHVATALAEDVSPELFGFSRPFEHILFSYSLSMIPDWRRALRTALAMLSANGMIHVVDFGDLNGLYPFAAKGLRAWLRLFHVTPRSELLRQVEIARNPPASGNLVVLPGRYAFLWQGTREELRRLAENPVAGEPQVIGKP